jgi:hypothetical protein
MNLQIIAIISVSFFFGVFIGALLSASQDSKKKDDIYNN